VVYYVDGHQARNKSDPFLCVIAAIMCREYMTWHEPKHNKTRKAGGTMAGTIREAERERQKQPRTFVRKDSA